MDIAQEMLTMFNEDLDLLKKVIIDDESWWYGYDIETKAQSFRRKRPEEPRPQKSKSSSVKCEGLAQYFHRLQGLGVS